MPNQNVRIVTLVDKNADFIKLQYDSINKFIKQDVEYIVFNNATSIEEREKISNICYKLNTRVINMPPLEDGEVRTYEFEPSDIVGISLSIMWDNYLKNMDGLLLCMDSDMFFIDEMNISELGNTYDIGYIPQYRYNYQLKYMWTGFFFLNMETIEKNLNFGYNYINDEKTDVGGKTSFFLQNRKYRELNFEFYTLYDIVNDIMSVSKDGYVMENISFSEYNKHIELINKYKFPQPYFFDLIKIKNSKTPFVFHYKSANWNPIYDNNENRYSVEKKAALKKMIKEYTKG